MSSGQAIGVRAAVGSIVLIGIGALAPRGAGQTVLAELRLPGEFGPIGEAVGVLGDLTGDGVMDVLVAGKVGTFVKSGADGSDLAFASNNNEAPLAVDGAGDLDGDGTPDFVTVTVERIRACSGADGSLLWGAPAGTGSNFKADVEALGDVSGDGVPDVAVSEAQVPNFPQLRVFSGANGALLYSETHTAFSMDSVEWDGTPGLELVVGEPDFVQHAAKSGRVRVIEPVGGATLATFFAGNDDQIGRSVATLGDVSGDGVPDLIASTAVIFGETTAWSGADGSVLYPLPSTFYFNIEGVGDVTGDGRPDFVGGGPGGGVGGIGTAQVRNGASGALVQGLSIPEAGAFRSFKGPGDVSGDGIPDLLVGSTGAVFQNIPSARLLQLPGGQLLQMLTNPTGATGLGRALDRVGDFDGDGDQDFVLGSTAGATIFSDEGDVLGQIASPALSIFGAGAVAVAGPGDVDGDGVPDVALGNGTNGASFNGRIALYSGADGSLIAEVLGALGDELGLAVVDVPDRTGDGVRDLWVSAPAIDLSGLTNVGEVRLLSGADLSLVSSLHGDVETNELFGTTLDADGDFDHDGVNDLAVGGAGGTMYIVSGATGLELARQVSTMPQPSLYASFAGDADGDGHEDYLAREPFYFDSPVPPIQPPGRVRLYSGASGVLLWQQIGTVPNGLLGMNAAGAGDVNGDGFADVAFTEASGDADTSSGTVYILSGVDGSTLDVYALPPGAGGIQPGAVMSAGYVDAGGCGDVIAGIPSLGNNGGAQLLASSAGGVHGFVDLGFGKPGAGGFTPELRGYGNLAAGGQVTIKVRYIQPFTNGSWFIGLSQGNLPFKQGVLVPSPFGPFFQFLVGSGPLGQITFTGTNPSASLTGLSLYHQFWFADPAATAGLSASNGMREIFK